MRVAKSLTEKGGSQRVGRACSSIFTNLKGGRRKKGEKGGGKGNINCEKEKRTVAGKAAECSSFPMWVGGQKKGEERREANSYQTALRKRAGRQQAPAADPRLRKKEGRGRTIIFETEKKGREERDGVGWGVESPCF